MHLESVKQLLKSRKILIFPNFVNMRDASQETTIFTQIVALLKKFVTFQLLQVEVENCLFHSQHLSLETVKLLIKSHKMLIAARFANMK